MVHESKKAGNVSVDEIKAAAAGQWASILTSVAGIGPEFLTGNNGPCPKCGGDDRWRFTDFENAGGAVCSQCLKENRRDGLHVIQWYLGCNFPEAVRLVAEYLAISPRANNTNRSETLKSTGPAVGQLKRVRKLGVDDANIVAGLLKSKPPIGGDALVKSVAEFVQWPAKSPEPMNCVAIPAYARANDNPTGWLLMRTDGQNFPAAPNGPGERNKHNLKGSADGWVVIGGWDALSAANVVWKCEGIPDALALDGVLPEGHCAVTNICGAGAAKSLPLEPLAGKTVRVVGDADHPGQQGATEFAAAAIGVARSVKLVQLPFNVTTNHGKDLRDFFNEGGTFHQLETIAEQAKPMIPRQNPSINPDNGTSGLQVVRVSDVEAEEVKWLWQGRIALGKQTLFAGDPGVGKSFLTAEIAAKVTTGGEWPDGSGQAPLGDVVFIMVEDGIGDTLRPRLDALGADVDRVHVIQLVGETDDSGKPIERVISLDKDYRLVDEFLADNPQVKMIIVDPLQAFLGNTNSNNNAETRRVTGPLSKLADKHHVALLTVDHLTKQAGNTKAIYRSLGSIGLVGNCRTAWLVCADKDNPDRVLMLQVKNNLHRKVPGLAYRIVDGPAGAIVEWDDEPIDVDADDALEQKPGPKPAKKTEAQSWLLNRLAGGEWHESNLVWDEAKKSGLKFTTYKRAKKELGVESEKDGDDGKWYMRLGHKQLEQHEQLLKTPGNNTGSSTNNDLEQLEHLEPGGAKQMSHVAQDVHEIQVGGQSELVQNGWPTEPPPGYHFSSDEDEVEWNF